MTDRQELERRVADAIRVAQDSILHGYDETPEPRDPSWVVYARAALDALGLTEETVWTDDGDPEVQRNTPEFTLDDPTMEQEDFVDEFFRKHGWKLKRRWATEWTEVSDGGA